MKERRTSWRGPPQVKNNAPDEEERSNDDDRAEEKEAEDRERRRHRILQYACHVGVFGTIRIARRLLPNTDDLPTSSMASVVPSRLAALTRLRCSIFQTAYNPQSLRTGAKYLRARLRGPSMLNYYPETLTVADLRKGCPDWQIQDQRELERLADIDDRKARGKGTPKKAKSSGSLHHLRFCSDVRSCLSYRSSRQSPSQEETLEYCLCFCSAVTPLLAYFIL